MEQTAVSLNGVGEAREFYNVADFLADLWAGKLGAPARPVERLALDTPVSVPCLNIEGIIDGLSTCDVNHYRVRFFDRRVWCVRQKWVTRGVIEVIGNKTAA